MAAITDPYQHHIQCQAWIDLLDQLNIGAFTVDLNRQITAMNYNAKALLGIRDNDVIGLDCRDVFTGVPCHRQCLFVPNNADLADEPAFEYPDDHDGTHMITRLATPVFDNDGQLVGCLTILQDHSPIADLINRVHYEARSLKITLDHLDIGVFTVNRGGLITFFNTAAEKITGYHREQILGQSCQQLFDGGGAKEFGLIKASMGDGITRANRSGQMRVKSGVRIPIQAAYMALRNEKGAIFGGLVTFNDLTLIRRFDQVISDRYTFHDMIGRDPAMQKVFELADVVADSDATILIEGDTGTGKDLLAKVIHSASDRSDKPFIKVNCAALPDTLLESEMFGYVKGAFTGADRDKPGRFDSAHKGTIFLDEIGDLTLPLQAKLLRVIEDKEFYPLGGHRTRKVDVRIISATNRGLDRLVAQKQFRRDLFYRLNVVRLTLPPLKQRRADLNLLIQHILRRLCAEKATHVPDVDENVMHILLNYPYPGNVRELENIIEHALIVSHYSRIKAQHLPDYLHAHTVPPNAGAPDANSRSNDTSEREKIVTALERCGWHRQKTAKRLGIDRTTLWRKMKKLGLIS